MSSPLASRNGHRTERHLLSVEGEEVIDLVEKHPVAYVPAGLWITGGLVVWIFATWLPEQLSWVVFFLGLGLIGWGVYRVVALMLDVFVITNMRVFRLSGVFAVQIATMPISRILDITVEKPLIGRLLGYGHFIFESAAQAQGLREIRFIGDPYERDLTIQRVVQRAGLRSRMPSEGSTS